jgi:hypothetical protein
MTVAGGRSAERATGVHVPVVSESMAFYFLNFTNALARLANCCRGCNLSFLERLA